MKIKLIIPLQIFFIFGSGYAQKKQCNCCTSEYKQFDFWLGDWEVFNLKGIKVGENKIVSLQDSCIIQENWTSNEQTGTSYNFPPVHAHFIMRV